MVVDCIRPAAFLVRQVPEWRLADAGRDQHPRVAIAALSEIDWNIAALDLEHPAALCNGARLRSFNLGLCHGVDSRLICWRSLATLTKHRVTTPSVGVEQ